VTEKEEWPSAPPGASRPKNLKTQSLVPSGWWVRPVRFRPYKIESVEASQTSPAPPVVNADYEALEMIFAVDSANVQPGKGIPFFGGFSLSE
jgi:hypothetical protein